MVAIGALVALGAELFVGFALAFAPGWANGWPGGLSIHRVWSAGMTAVLTAIGLTAGLGLGSLLCLLLCRSPSGHRLVWPIFAAWLMACAALAVPSHSWLYREVYASTLEMWPNGYGPGP